MPRSGLKGPSPSPSCLLAGGEREWGGACPRAPAPLVPRPSSGAAARIRGLGVAAASSPVRSSSHLGLPGRRGPGGGVQRGQRLPLQREPSGGGGADPRQGQQPPGARRRVCECRGPARALQRRPAGAGPPPGVTGPAAARRNEGTSRKEPGPRVEAVASRPRLSLEGTQGLRAPFSPS